MNKSVMKTSNKREKSQLGSSFASFIMSVILLLLLGGCGEMQGTANSSSEAFTAQTLSEVPEYSGEAYIYINQNAPEFTEEEMTTEEFELYSDLDSLGRCQTAFANICPGLMPSEERGEIGDVRPSGWHTVKYGIIPDKYLYNRCHLIGYQLAGENANEKNLITGTRYFNMTGMLPFENEVSDYVALTGNHVLYRVTPFYDGDNLVAKGVQMEARSVEDSGSGISFNVFVYNVQPGIIIDYATGDSYEDPDYIKAEAGELTYILNTNTKKFHLPDCSSVKEMSDKNKQSFTGSRSDIISMGYSPCQNCNP